MRLSQVVCNKGVDIISSFLNCWGVGVIFLGPISQLSLWSLGISFTLLPCLLFLAECPQLCLLKWQHLPSESLCASWEDSKTQQS